MILVALRKQFKGLGGGGGDDDDDADIILWKVTDHATLPK